ncbi:MAG: hypothetical protein MUP70_09135 [Candidatus Aminicenantes bacterium]|nr:hypothetical protein [Candidatus Aminicenantes bacterium]
MNDKRGIFFLLVFLSLTSCFLFFGFLTFGQTPPHFYDAGKEIQIDGTIVKIGMEPRYKEGAPFIVLTMSQKTTEALFQVEVSPAWFFEQNFFQGESLRVIGSLYSSEGISQVIARRIRISGNWLILRDKNGFPQWRGGKSAKMRKGWRRKF